MSAWTAPCSHTVGARIGTPVLGTCGGFQHALIEYARNVLGMAEADHAESKPELPPCRSCRDWPARWAAPKETIRLEPGSRLSAIYGRNEIVESYQCNFGLNPRYQSLLDTAVLAIVGRDENGEVRAVEMSGDPFFIATRINRNNPPLAARRIR